MNLSIYFPIQLWIYENNNEKKYRLQPPKYDTITTFDFYNHFMENYPKKLNIYPELQTKWKLKTTFWGINPKYINYVRRGFFFVLISQNDVYPFESFKIISTPLEISDQKESFLLGHYKYPIRGTTLLFISSYIHNSKIRDILLISEDKQENDENYNFLPLKKNKNIPFYNTFHYDVSNFMFVFRQKPKGIFWKANQENICIPSSDPNDYKTIIDCAFNNNDKIYPRNIFLESNNDPLFSILNPSKPNSKTFIYYFLLSIIILILLNLSLWLWKKYRAKKLKYIIKSK